MNRSSVEPFFHKRVSLWIGSDPLPHFGTLVRLQGVDVALQPIPYRPAERNGGGPWPIADLRHVEEA
jgi:hypothetical protein